MTQSVRTERRNLGTRAAWVLGDQIVSSLANAALSIVIARAVSPVEYGAFALAFSVYSFCVAVSNALAGQVFMIRFSAADPRRLHNAVASAAGASLALGLVAAVLVGLVSSTLNMPLSGVMLAVGCLLPALMLQDTWRTVFVSRGTPAQAFTNDLLWTALQIALIASLFAVRADRAIWFVLAWGSAALVAAAVGIRQAGTPPSLRTASAFVRENGDISGPSVANAVAVLGAGQVAFVLIASVASVETIGALRAAQTLLGPVNIVGFALTAFAVPEIVRRNLTRRQLVVVALTLSGLLVTADLAWGGLLLLLPSETGEQMLGETWKAARDTLPGLTVFTACIGATVGATAVMRALAWTRSAFWVSAMLGPLVILLGVLGATLGGATGAAWGLAVAAALPIAPCWLLLVRAATRGRRLVLDVSGPSDRDVSGADF